MKHKFVVLALVVVLIAVVSFFLIGGDSGEAVGKEGAITQTAQATTQQAKRPDAVKTANAQKKPTAPWNIRCLKDKDGNRSACEVFQLISVKETGERVAEFKVGFPDGKDKAAKGVIILPLGILLPAGVIMQIDEKEDAVFKFAIRSCTPAGCFAHVSLTPEIMETLRKGSEAALHFKSNDGRNVIIKISLKGFTKAVAALPL